MFDKWIRHALGPFLTILIAASSFVLDREPNVILLILSVCLFSGSMIFRKIIPYSFVFHTVFLALFHWSSHLNWCLLLYLMLLVVAIRNKVGHISVMWLALGYSLLYSMIRLSYVPVNDYNLLVTVYDITAFLFFVILLRYHFTALLEKRRLEKSNNFLTTHDSLTKLLNYDGYIKSITELINKNIPFILVILDFQDFKSVNNKSVSNGDEVLTNISILLRSYFPNANAISRYAGDRFALVFPQMENTLDEIVSILDRNALGYQVAYSNTFFPQEARYAQELIAMSEDRLFQKKRILWLKREEELFRSEKMKIVGELAAGMAHEIRNPLTTMLGFMQLSKSQSYNIQPWFEIMMNEITRMNELTAEFLQFSKPHINNIKPEMISKCIERVRYLTESQAISKGHNLMLDQIDGSIIVLMDRDKIVQVLLNLIRNAIDAMKEPGEIYIRAEKIKNEVIIEIEDTGMGIEESELENIFNPFYTTKESGTGLGLSICYKIVQDHGGTMSVLSLVGHGSVFSVKLPAV